MLKTIRTTMLQSMRLLRKHSQVMQIYSCLNRNPEPILRSEDGFKVQHRNVQGKRFKNLLKQYNASVCEAVLYSLDYKLLKLGTPGLIISHQDKFKVHHISIWEICLKIFFSSNTILLLIILQCISILISLYHHIKVIVTLCHFLQVILQICQLFFTLMHRTIRFASNDQILGYDVKKVSFFISIVQSIVKY